MEFDEEEAIRNLRDAEARKSADREKRRLEVLARVKSVLEEYFRDSSSQVFLIGSILQPGKFHSGSDVDIVLKGYEGNRFELWTELERKIDLPIEILYYEEIDFQKHVEENGLRLK